MHGTTKHANRRSKAQRRHDRQRIAAWYLQGHSQADIAARLGLSQQQISFDLQRLYREWGERAARDIDAARARELAKLDRIEAELWKRHRAALQPRTKRLVQRLHDRETEMRAYTEEGAGDPRWISLILQCVAQRARVLGLEKQEQAVAAVRALVVHPRQLEAEEWAAQFGGRVLEAHHREPC